MGHIEVAVDGGVLSARSDGSGEPVMVVQTALSVDELVPVMRLLREREGSTAALEEVMTMLSGRDWRSRQEALVPGSVARLERDADAFFLRDIPALLGWQYGADDATRVSAPVLYVGGTDSGSWFQQTKAWVRALFPGMSCVMINSAGHDLALTHPTELASAITAFIAAQDDRPEA